MLLFKNIKAQDVARLFNRRNLWSRNLLGTGCFILLYRSTTYRSREHLQKLDHLTGFEGYHLA